MTYTSPQASDPQYGGTIGFYKSGSEVVDYVYVDFTVRYSDMDHDGDPNPEMDAFFQALVDKLSEFANSAPGFDPTDLSAGKSISMGQACLPTEEPTP